MRNILVVSVHPDDETLGCGGTLLKHKANGDRIYWLIATRITKKDRSSRKQSREARETIDKVFRMYRFNGIHQLRIPTMKTDVVPKIEIIEKISNVIKKTRPDILYLPYNKDVHSDHRVIFDAAYSCTKAFRYRFIKKIMMMETISETEFAPGLKESTFMPNYFVDITDFLQKKIDILKVFKNEIKDPPFPRSVENIKALATYRGSTAGYKYAESFMILKEIW